jgi:hypothetical protein
MASNYAELKVYIGYVCSVTLTHNAQISNHATEMRSAKRKNTEIKIQAKMCGLIKGRTTKTNRKNGIQATRATWCRQRVTNRYVKNAKDILQKMSGQTLRRADARHEHSVSELTRMR